MRPVESNVRPPAVEVERDGDRARVTLRDGFEEVVRDDEGAVWAWQERTCTVPWMDGLDEVVAADFTAWAEYADLLDNIAQATEEAKQALKRAVEALPTYEELNDAALMELGDLAAETQSTGADTTARMDAVEEALMEIGDIVGGGK